MAARKSPTAADLLALAEEHLKRVQAAWDAFKDPDICHQVLADNSRSSLVRSIPECRREESVHQGRYCNRVQCSAVSPGVDENSRGPIVCSLSTN
jgi:hypothetical protein